jgi:hypothetical protein
LLNNQYKNNIILSTLIVIIQKSVFLSCLFSK